MSDKAIVALVCLTARDLMAPDVIEDPPEELVALAAAAAGLPELYDGSSAAAFELASTEAPIALFERLVNCGVEDADKYFECIAELHRRRLRYEYILSNQPFPRLEQVGPRAMLQYGQANAATLAVLLTWRKWIYDIDNRAAQETGYVFEAALTGALGGISCSPRNSPIRRLNDPTKGRQIDCLLETSDGRRWAYEFKIRVTIAASGQGRWTEELSFPVEAQAAGLIPVLTVFDGTANDKLSQLCDAYRAVGGLAYTGDTAWEHIEARSGRVMAYFVEKYLRGPLADLLLHEPVRDGLPSIEFSMGEQQIAVAVAGWGAMTIDRSPSKADVVIFEEDP